MEFLPVVGNFVVVAEQEIAWRQTEIMAKAGIIQCGIEGVEGLKILCCKGFSQACMARLNPVAHVTEGGPVHGLAIDRETVGQALLSLPAASWCDQVAVIAPVKTP